VFRQVVSHQSEQQKLPGCVQNASAELVFFFIFKFYRDKKTARVKPLLPEWFAVIQKIEYFNILFNGGWLLDGGKIAKKLF
jgi:hypothetical protein